MQIVKIENSNYGTDGAILLNTDSQRSFVTESVRKKLKLPTLRKETMVFQVFGQNDTKNGLCIFIVAISCPKICSPIRNQKYHLAKNDHLRNINLIKHSEGDSTSTIYKIRNTGSGNGMQRTRGIGGMLYSGECPQTFLGMSPIIPGNVAEHFRECP